MTATKVPYVAPTVTPVDPRSETGRRIARELGQLVADVEDRLAREAAQARPSEGRTA